MNEHLRWLKKCPNVSVSAYDGTLPANTVYVQEFADPAVMLAIAEGVVNRLVSACWRRGGVHHPK